MTEEVDLFSLTTGLPLDGATVVITSAKFGYNAEVDSRRGAETPNIYLTLTLEDKENPGNPVTENMSIGSKHELADKDGKAVRAKTKDPRFSERTVYGQFINATRVASGVSLEDLRTHGDPLHAEMWVGSNWVYGPVFDPNTQKNRLLPVEYLGYTEGAAKKNSVKVDKNVLSDEDRGKLLEIASECETHEEFMDKVFSEHQELAVKQAVQKAIAATGEDSVWSEARA